MQLVLSENNQHWTEQCETEQRPPVANIQFNGFQSTIWQFWYQNQQLTIFHNNRCVPSTIWQYTSSRTGTSSKQSFTTINGFAYYLCAISQMRSLLVGCCITEGTILTILTILDTQNIFFKLLQSLQAAALQRGPFLPFSHRQCSQEFP